MASLSRIFSHRGVRVAAGVFLVLAVVGAVSAPNVWAAELSSPNALDWMMNIIGGLFMNLAAGIGALISNFIEIIVAVLQYNNFSNSPVVNAGWAIIRDTVNMFYVVLLIIIAFGTIIGSSKFSWAQDISKLLRWAIIINFSKTLCGLMIDASQVVTLTFANAIKDIAGGNFVTFLGLNSILSLSTQTPDLTSGNPGGYQSFDFLVGGIMAFVMMLIVLVVLVALLAILAFRIVMLWILITISPLTWFANSIPKGISIGQSAYQEWWGNFKCYLLVGPVLVFFLWLALAVAGAGNIAAVEGFNVADTNNSGMINQIFDMPRLTSFIIGLALIMAGFQQAAGICKAAQGMGSLSVGSMLKKAEATVFGGKGGFAGEGGLVKPWRAGSGIALASNKVLGAERMRRIQSTVGRMPLVGSAAAGALAGSIGEQEKAEKEKKVANAKQIGDIGKSIGDDKAQLEFVKKMGESSDGKVGVFGSAKRDQSLAMAKKLVEDKSFREKMEREGVPVEKILSMNADATKDAFGKDDDFKKKFDEFKKQRPDIYAKTEDMKDANGQPVLSADGKPKKKYKFNDAIKTVEDLKKVDWEAAERMKEGNPEAFAQFDEFLKKTFKGEKDSNTGEVLSGYQMLERGLLGKDAFQKYQRPPETLDNLVAAGFEAATGEFKTEAQQKQLDNALKADLGNIRVVPMEAIAARGGDNTLTRSLTKALSAGTGKKGGGGGGGSDLLFRNVRRKEAGATDAVTRVGLALAQVQNTGDKKTNEAARKFFTQLDAAVKKGDYTPPEDFPPIAEMIERFKDQKPERQARGEREARPGREATTTATQTTEASPVTVVEAPRRRVERAPEATQAPTAPTPNTFTTQAREMPEAERENLIRIEEQEMARQRTLADAAERAGDTVAYQRAREQYDQISQRMNGYRQARNPEPPTTT